LNYELLVLSLPDSPRRAQLPNRLRAPYQVVDGVLVPRAAAERHVFVSAWCRAHGIAKPKGLPEALRRRGDLGCKLAWLHLLWQVARDCDGLVVAIEDDVAIRADIHLATWDPRPYAVPGRMRSLFSVTGYATWGLLFHAKDAGHWFEEHATRWLSLRSPIDIIWWRSGLIEPWQGKPEWIVDHPRALNDPDNSERARLNGRLRQVIDFVKAHSPL
jgi:hypothetical protein